MNDPHQPNVLEQARKAAAAGSWQEAYDWLAAADDSIPLTGPDLALFADVAYAAGNIDKTIAVWERAHSEAIEAGDSLSAAGAAVHVAMHLLFDTALMAPVRGWIKRTERLLDGQPETPIHAWLAVVKNYERLLSGDFETARQWARVAIELGSKLNPAAAAIGRVAEARSLILEGETTQGLALLNDAGFAAVSGEIDPLSTGIVYCEVVCALQALAQYDLAEQWTEAMERWRHGRAVGSVHGRCRVHRAEILRLRGSCVEAEKEALQACEELRPYLRREFGWPLTELGRIRLRTGDIQGAEEAFYAAHEIGWDPQPGLALVHLARGDVQSASASIRDALDHPPAVPSKEWPPNTELRRAPLLEAQVEIEIAAGNLDLARSAADELAGVALRFESKALAASGCLARARVQFAEGDISGARRSFQEAAHRWNEVGAPYETALARMGLAFTHRAEGREEQAVMEFRAARSSFERVGAMHQAGRAAEGCSITAEISPIGGTVHRVARPPTDARSPDQNVFRREGDYWSLVFNGQTVRIHDLRGLQHLSRLLAEPGREFHVLDMAAESGAFEGTRHFTEPNMTHTSGLDIGPVLDGSAKEAYRRRLAEIEDDIEEARATADSERLEQATAEREFLVRELSRAVGLGGRDRRMGSASERARASVTRAVRQAVARIQVYHPGLAEHLNRTIRTGTFCAYLPDSRFPVGWKL